MRAMGLFKNLLIRMNRRRLLLQNTLATLLAGWLRPARAKAPDWVIDVPLGRDQVQLEVRHYGHDGREGGLRYLSLHENEHTAVEAAERVLQKHGGTLIELRGQGRRQVVFHDGERALAFDPNRIFTDAGAEATLRRNDSLTDEGVQAVRALRAAVLALLDGRPDEPVVALHNNAGKGYTFDNYAPGAALAGDVEALSAQPQRPRDAFFLVTRMALFEALRAARFNVVLQSDHAEDDGSLSIYFQQQRRAYVNVEAGFGALREQAEMLDAVAGLRP